MLSLAQPLRTQNPAIEGSGKTVGFQSVAKSLVKRLVRLGVPRLKPRVLRTIPHDPKAYTQGLLYRNGLLYESTGTWEASSLRCIDPANGNILILVPIPGDFAEGIAALDERLFQLSWKSGIARIYRFPDLSRIGEVQYEGEGWGLTSQGNHLIMSNGTEVLCFRDSSMRITREISVRRRGRPLTLINDLAFVNGSVYANVLFSDQVFQIGLETGQVRRIVDCSGLYAAAAPGTDEGVLNGITYAMDRQSFFLTGKNWTSIFEVSMTGNR